MSDAPRQVYDEHVRALAAGEVDAVAAGCAADAVMVANGAVHSGREAIRAVFASEDGRGLWGERTWT